MEDLWKFQGTEGLKDQFSKGKYEATLELKEEELKPSLRGGGWGGVQGLWVFPIYLFKCLVF